MVIIVIKKYIKGKNDENKKRRMYYIKEYAFIY